MKNKEVVKHVVDAMLKPDIEAVLSHMTEDIKMKNKDQSPVSILALKTLSSANSTSSSSASGSSCL